jgi:hypothetical protein
LKTAARYRFFFVMHIQARTIRRGGELLKQVMPSRGAHQNIRDGGCATGGRKLAAEAAVMSKRQRKTA